MHAALVTLLCWAMMGAACVLPPGGVGVPVALATLVALIGLPHGAADHRFARPLLEPVLGPGWLPVFLVGYLLVAIVVGYGWFVAPAATILSFFLLSAWHFGEEEPRFAIGPRSVRPLFRFARGGLVIWATVALRPEGVSSVLSVVAPRSLGGQIELATQLMWVVSLAMLACAAVAWGLQSVAAAASSGRKRRVLAVDSVMQVSLVLLFASASPVVGFLVYFCAWHSARGLRRLRRDLDESWPRLAASLAPMTAAAIGLIALTATLTMRAATWDETLVRSTFVGLSAVAMPHIVLHGAAPLLGPAGDRRLARELSLGGPA